MPEQKEGGYKPDEEEITNTETKRLRDSAVEQRIYSTRTQLEQLKEMGEGEYNNRTKELAGAIIPLIASVFQEIADQLAEKRRESAGDWWGQAEAIAELGYLHEDFEKIFGRNRGFHEPTPIGSPVELNPLDLKGEDTTYPVTLWVLEKYEDSEIQRSVDIPREVWSKIKTQLTQDKRDFIDLIKFHDELERELRILKEANEIRTYFQEIGLSPDDPNIF